MPLAALARDDHAKFEALGGVWDDTGNLSRRVTFVVDGAGVVRWVDAGGLAIDTTRTLAALARLAR